MKREKALAAGQGGASGLQEVLPPSRDEFHRQTAVEALARHLTNSQAFMARLDVLSQAHRGDRLGPVNAASRLLTANAQVAKALAQVALLERRSRVIVERIEPLTGKNAELNSPFPPQEDARAKLEARLDALLEAARSTADIIEPGDGI